ncbi:toxin-antitoxin system YwqK family antitoxin, partial [Helicobacter bilis]
ENGKLERETPFKNDKAEGIAKEYYESGELRAETPFKNDKREGIEKWYYWNGNLMAEISYLNYYFHGDMTYYTEDKKLLALVKAENGRITSGKCFNDKVLTDKEIDDLSGLKSIEEPINYL